jgi:hypothetical protein
MVKNNDKTIEEKLDDFMDDLYKKYHSTKKNLDKLRFIDRWSRLCEIKLKYTSGGLQKQNKIITNILNATWEEVVDEIKAEDLHIIDIEESVDDNAIP